MWVLFLPLVIFTMVGKPLIHTLVTCSDVVHSNGFFELLEEVDASIESLDLYCFEEVAEEEAESEQVESDSGNWLIELFCNTDNWFIQEHTVNSIWGHSSSFQHALQTSVAPPPERSFLN